MPWLDAIRKIIINRPNDAPCDAKWIQPDHSNTSHNRNISLPYIDVSNDFNCFLLWYWVCALNWHRNLWIYACNSIVSVRGGKMSRVGESMYNLYVVFYWLDMGLLKLRNLYVIFHWPDMGLLNCMQQRVHSKCDVLSNCMHISLQHTR